MLWGAAGYSSFFTKWDSLNTAGNLGSGVGLGFNILIMEHLIFSIGIEYLYLNSSIRPVDFSFTRFNLQDTEGEYYDMKYTLKKFVQIDQTHNFFIPIYLGFKTNLRKLDFFVLAGGKFGYMFSARSISKIGSYTTIGEYERFIDPFKDMPNHYFTSNQRYNHNNTLNFNKLQAAASLELGIELPSVVENNGIRISFFADYGLLNRQTSAVQKQRNDLFTFEDIPNIIHVNNLYETSYKKSTHTATFFAGLKITLLINISKAPCPKCL